MADRNRQVARIYSVLQMLEGAPQGLTAREIRERLPDDLQADKKTVQRDLEALERVGFPLMCEEGAGEANAHRWSLTRATQVSKTLMLDARELFALYLAKGALLPLRDTPFFADLERFFGKVEVMLGKAHLQHLQELSQELYFRPLPEWGLGVRPEIIDTLHAACSEKQVLSISYSGVRDLESRVRRLGPQYLYFVQGALYLVAEDLDAERAGQIKVFAVPRIQSAEMLEQAYEGTVIRPEQLFKDAFSIFAAKEPVKIQVRFTGYAAKYVSERKFHPSQRRVVRGPNTVELELEVGLTPELVGWILQFGPDARVLQPQALADQVMETLEETLGIYKKRAA